MNEKVKPFYECEHCYKKLTTQARLDKHSCEQKKRAEYMATPKGIGALYCYETWMSLQGYSTKGVEAFMESKFFKPIERFVKFCNSTAIPDREHYIKFMVSKGLLPSKWYDVDVYDEYLQHFDRSVTPLEAARITADTLYDLADLFECEIPEVLGHIAASDLMKLVVARKISPWLLLLSKSFLQYMKNEVTPEQRLLIHATISHDVWSKKFKDHPETIKVMKEIVTELDF